ncbi:MAG: hypothetical protein LCI00_29375 [Chloroflexi bacterium]|nr:hypothetical protein [Chloroflexota bacterium]MCC6893687.1 hypothetical protein [Anaerolineae bacterium]
MNDTFFPQMSLWTGGILIIWGLKMYTCALIQVRRFNNPQLKTRLSDVRFRPLEALGSW